MGVRMRINIRAYTVFYVLYLAYVLTTTTHRPSVHSFTKELPVPVAVIVATVLRQAQLPTCALSELR